MAFAALYVYMEADSCPHLLPACCRRQGRVGAAAGQEGKAGGGRQAWPGGHRWAANFILLAGTEVRSSQHSVCCKQDPLDHIAIPSLLPLHKLPAPPPSNYPAVETAAEVRAQLAALLAEPLQPKFSRKWFTGGAAAAVMAAVDPSAPAAPGGKKRKAAQPAAGERGAAAGEEAAPVPEPRTVQTVSQAVALAQQQADSRSRAAGAAGAAGGKQQTQKKAGKKKVQDPRAAALQAALNKALTAKQRKKAGGRGMTVVATALGREASGPDALQALRQKLGGR